MLNDYYSKWYNMHKVSYLLLFLSLSNLIHAQEVINPLVEDGRMWRLVSLIPTETPQEQNNVDYYQDLSGKWCTGVSHTYELCGDTLINDKSYTMLIQDGKHYVGGLR